MSAGSPRPSAVAIAPRPDWLALGAALVTVVLWASAFVGIRAVAPHLSPGALAFGRLLVGTLVLGMVVVARRAPLPRGRALLLTIASGVLSFGLYNVVLNAAEQLVDAGTAAMLVNLGPILIAFLAGLFLGEGFPPRLVAGCGIAFAGTAIIGLATGGNAGAGAVAGILLCLAAAAAYAAGVTLQKPALRTTPALSVTWLGCAVGMLACKSFAPTRSRGGLSWPRRAQPAA